jgi:hypothetical protein
MVAADTWALRLILFFLGVRQFLVAASISPALLLFLRGVHGVERPRAAPAGTAVAEMQIVFAF